MTDPIREALNSFLARKSVPARIKGDEAAADEAAAILRAMRRAAPKMAGREWAEEFLDIIERREKAPVWPTVLDIERLAKERRADQPKVDIPVTDAVQLFANRMHADERVSEDDLFGLVGWKAQRLGLITHEFADEWRARCVAARVALYGEAATEAWLQDRRDRLRAAIAIDREGGPKPIGRRMDLTAAAAMVKRMSDPMEAAE